MILKNKNNKKFVNKSFKISYAVILGNMLVLNTSKSTSNQILKKKSNQIKLKTKQKILEKSSNVSKVGIVRAFWKHTKDGINQRENC
jgi:hypothetical protein